MTLKEAEVVALSTLKQVMEEKVRAQLLHVFGLPVMTSGTFRPALHCQLQKCPAQLLMCECNEHPCR